MHTSASNKHKRATQHGQESVQAMTNCRAVDMPEVSSSWPLAVKAAVLTVPFIFSVVTLCLDLSDTKGTHPSLPRKATSGLLLDGQVTKLSKLFSSLPRMPCTFSTRDAAKS